MRRFLRSHQIEMGIAVAVLLLTAILVLSLRIQTITVTESSRYSADEIEELLFSGRMGKNSIYAYAMDKLKPHRQIPFVDDYRVIFHSPWNVEVIIYEKNIVGYVSYMSSYMYFDRDGIIVESSGSKLPGVPWITGMEFGQIVLYKPLPVADDRVFGDILNLTQQLALYDIPVDRIQYDSGGNATLFIGKMEVTMGDDADIDGKISTLKDILKAQPQLMEMEGVLMLENYTESNSRKEITFKRK